MRISCADKIEEMCDGLAGLSGILRSFCAEMKEAGDCNDEGCPFADNCPEYCFSDALNFSEAASEIYSLVERWEYDQGGEYEDGD